MSKSHRDAVVRFCLGLNRNGWLELGDIEVYVRKSMRVFNSDTYYCFDIGNIQSHDPGKGAVKNFLSELIPLLAELKFDALFIENVMNERLASHFRKSFTELHPDPYVPSFLLNLKEYVMGNRDKPKKEAKKPKKEAKKPKKEAKKPKKDKK